MSVAEVEAIFEHSPDYLRPALRMFVTSGVRRDELVNMKFADVDLEARTVTVRAEYSKNHKAREIPLDDEMVGIIEALKARAKDRQPVAGNTKRFTERQAANFSRDHVFVTKANTPWRNNLLTRFYAVCKKAGIADAIPGGPVDLHSLRVTFTTLSIDHGASPRAVQSILGHSSLNLTMSIYAKATERSKRDAVGALPFAKTSGPNHVIPLVRTDSGMSNHGDVSDAKSHVSRTIVSVSTQADGIKSVTA
ncbi:MAG: site-specific integrase [Planctomycetota bacterium]